MAESPKRLELLARSAAGNRLSFFLKPCPPGFSAAVADSTSDGGIESFVATGETKSVALAGALALWRDGQNVDTPETQSLAAGRDPLDNVRAIAVILSAFGRTGEFHPSGIAE